MKNYCFGIDVGGTTVKLGLFSTAGELLDKWEITTRTENFGENILSDICEAMEARLAEKEISLDDIEGVGIGLPGPITNDGTVLQCVNLGWGTFNVEEKLSEMFRGIKVKAGNDANVAALGEAWQGGGKDYDDIVMITLGTGVGGGVIINGKILTGYNGGAGEIGHMHVDDNETDSCNCGRKGCLEQYASATGLVRLAKRYFEKNTKNSILTGKEITAKEVFDAAKAGDAAALEITEEFGAYLGQALVNLAATVDPAVFVIGGGVSKAGDILLETVRKYFYDHAFYGNQKTKITLATLGNDAGIYGAAKQVL